MFQCGWLARHSKHVLQSDRMMLMPSSSKGSVRGSAIFTEYLHIMTARLALLGIGDSRRPFRHSLADVVGVCSSVPGLLTDFLVVHSFLASQELC